MNRNAVTCPPCGENIGLPTKRGAHQGFTLIELLVVVLIIGILVAVAVPQYRVAVAKSHAMQALTAVKTLSENIEQYYVENGAYPPTYNESELNKVLSVSYKLPKNFAITGISATYIGIQYGPGTKNKESFFMISRILRHANSGNRGKFVCSTAYEEDNNVLASRVCKNLCRTSTLTKMWGSGEFGCKMDF